MKTADQIRRQLAAGQFDLSRHAFIRAVERNISDEEIRVAGGQARTIESYPEDKYSPSILMLGFTAVGRPLHIQVSLMDSELARIITLYEPDSGEWTKFEIRR